MKLSLTVIEQGGKNRCKRENDRSAIRSINQTKVCVPCCALFLPVKIIWTNRGAFYSSLTEVLKKSLYSSCNIFNFLHITHLSSVHLRNQVKSV